MFSPTTTLQLVAFLDLLAVGLILPQLSPQARSLGCNHVLVGFMGSLYFALQLVSSPMTGSLSDLKGRLETLLVTLSLSGVAYVLLGLTNSIVLFLALRAVLGTTKHTQLLTSALVSDYVKDENQLSQVCGKLAIVKRAGLAIGPIFGGHIVEAFPENGFTIIAFAVGAVFAINAELARRLPKVKTEKKKDEKPISPALIGNIKISVIESVEQFYKINWHKYWEVFSIRLLIASCLTVFKINCVLFLKFKHGVTPVTTGYIISTFSAIDSLTCFFLGRINKYYKDDKDFSQRILHVFSVLTLSLLGVTFASNVFLYVAFIIPLRISATVGMMKTREIIMSKSDNDQRGTVLGVLNNVRSLTEVIAPLLTGILYEYIGVLRVVYVAIFFAAVGTYKSYVIRNKSVKSKMK